MTYKCNKCGMESENGKTIEHGFVYITIYPNKPKPSEKCNGKFIEVKK